MPDRNVHHRDRDHFGEDLDLYVGLTAALGPFEAGTPITYVIRELWTRLLALESGAHRLGFFTINAYVLAPGGSIGTVPGNIRAVFTINAIAKKAVTGSFTIDGYVAKRGSFTIDGYVRPSSSFTIDGFVI